MAITAQLVKDLRERTGAGMMECKKALVETSGDLDAAVELMRKKGQAKAEKKSGRTAAEGVVIARVDEQGQKAILLEINSETDFVGRDDNFKSFASQVADVALAQSIAEVETLATASIDGSTVEEARLALISKVGENIQIRRIQLFTAQEGTFGSYVHTGRIGVIAHLTSSDATLAKDIAMHVAACNPECVNADEVPQDLIEKEKEIFSAQALKEGKPEAIVEKMVSGRIKKFLNEICLVGQEFVKDPSLTVEKVLAEQGAEVKSFCRFELGEGIEKEESNFADEVMSQVRGA